MKFAEYKCIKCNFKWEQPPMPQIGFDGKFLGNIYATDCPKCNSAYIKWLNYDVK